MLEPVQVEEQEGPPSAVPVRGLERLRGVREEGGPVGQLGQGVVAGAVQRAGVGQVAFVVSRGQAQVDQHQDEREDDDPDQGVVSPAHREADRGPGGDHEEQEEHRSSAWASFGCGSRLTGQIDRRRVRGGNDHRGDRRDDGDIQYRHQGGAVEVVGRGEGRGGDEASSSGNQERRDGRDLTPDRVGQPEGDHQHQPVAGGEEGRRGRTSHPAVGGAQFRASKAGGQQSTPEGEEDPTADDAAVQQHGPAALPRMGEQESDVAGDERQIGDDHPHVALCEDPG